MTIIHTVNKNAMQKFYTACKLNLNKIGYPPFFCRAYHFRKAEAREKEVYIEHDRLSGARHAVRLKVNRDKYTISEVERLFNVAFAASEAELEGAEETVLLRMNMSIEEVIARKGKPKTRVVLGSKTVLTYDDLKLIFKDGKLVDAE